MLSCLRDGASLYHNENLFRTVSNKSLFSVFRSGERNSDALKLKDLELLFKQGADINEVDTEFKMNFLQRLIVEFSEGSEKEELRKIYEWLYSNGIDINHRDKDGRSALHLAVSEDKFSIVKWLLDKGANRNSVDEDGRTAFDYLNDLKLLFMSDASDRQETLMLLQNRQGENMTLFSPEKQKTVWDVQTTIRQIDMSLYPSVKNEIGADQTFVYSTLAGCCALIDSKQLAKFSDEIQLFGTNVIRPVVEACFKEIGNSNCKLNDVKLKLSLLKNLQAIQFYPKKIDFRTINDEQMITELQKVIQIGSYTLYKVNPNSEKFYGGRIDISRESFAQAAQILENNGYKQKQDVLGSSFDRQGHITTIDPSELAQNYESIVSSHETFTKSSKEVRLKPIDIRVGAPQSGRMSRVVTITVEVEDLEKYRGALGAMKFSPHLSVFSQEIQPISSLQQISIHAFTKDVDNEYLMKLNQCLANVGSKEEKKRNK